MDSIPLILRSVHALTSEQMFFVVAVGALLLAGVIAIAALKGGRRDHRS